MIAKRFKTAHSQETRFADYTRLAITCVWIVVGISSLFFQNICFVGFPLWGGRITNVFVYFLSSFIKIVVICFWTTSWMITVFLGFHAQVHQQTQITPPKKIERVKRKHIHTKQNNPNEIIEND